MTIMSQNDFSILIENKAKQNKQTHLEALIGYCEDNYVEFETAAKMVDGPLKDKIRQNFVEAHMLPKSATFKI